MNPILCQALLRKIFIFRFSEKYGCLPASRPGKRDVTADRHETWGGDAMDASTSTTIEADADGEIAWSWRPDAGVKFAMTKSQATEANKPGTPGRARYKP
jgi:hypothetical protein